MKDTCGFCVTSRSKIFIDSRDMTTTLLLTTCSLLCDIVSFPSSHQLSGKPGNVTVDKRIWTQQPTRSSKNFCYNHWSNRTESTFNSRPAVFIYPGMFLTLVGFAWRHVVEYSLTGRDIHDHEYSNEVASTKGKMSEPGPKLEVTKEKKRM